MRLKLYSLTSLCAIAFILTAGGGQLAAQNSTMEDGEGMVIEEKSARKLKDADATNPAGIVSAPAPEGVVDEAAAVSSGAAVEEKEPGEGRIKIDEAMVEKIIPSYSFGMKRLMKNAEKNIERIKKELARKEKLKKKSGDAGMKKGAEENLVSAAPGTKKVGAKENRGTTDDRSKARTIRSAQAERPERRKCEVSFKSRAEGTRMARQRCQAERREHLEASRRECEKREVEHKKRIEAGRKCRMDESAVRKSSPGAGSSADDEALKNLARQEEQIKAEQARFARERARYVDRVPAISEAATASDQERQEADLKAEQARFAKERARYTTKTPPADSEGMLKTWEKYGVATKEEIAREREYIKGEK